MNPAFIADGLLLFHAAFVAWAALGGFLVLRWPRLAALHLPALAWAVWIEASGGICPLTPLEMRWRAAAGQVVDTSQSFVEQHVMWWLYPDGLTRSTQWLLAALLLGGNALIYAAAWRRWRS